MSYRRSTYDPLAAMPPQPIVRPFDRWQRFGVVTEVIALGLFLLWIAESAGVARTGFDSPVFAFPFFVGGTFMLRLDPVLEAGVLGDRKWQLAAILLGVALLPVAFLP